MEKTTSLRRIFLVGFILAIFLLFAFRLFQFQIVNGETYLSQTKKKYYTSVSIPAIRGEIKDRKGRPIVENKLGFAVVLERSYLPKGKENEVILKLIELMEKNDETYEKTNAINAYKNPDVPSGLTLKFNEEEKSSVSKLKSVLRLQQYATEQNCFDAMIKKYGLESFPRETAFEIGCIRFEMERRDFSEAIPFTFAQSVGNKTIAILKENNIEYPGATIQSQPQRQYIDSTLAPHMIGEIGPIYAEDYQRLKLKGYRMNDVLGVSGLEAAMEEYLRGEDGKKSIILNEYGEVEYEKILIPPVPGNTVYLTLDMKLQKKAQEILEKNIKRLQNQGGKGWDCTSGAFVVIDVNSGDILASATYPSYDLKDFHEKYDELIANKDKPLLNRAFDGIYAPGSCMKPSVALGALEDGIITDQSYIPCNHVYTYFVTDTDDYAPTCMGYHGSIDIYTALKVSCNIFFFDTGRRATIERMNYYSKQLGLGQPTGVEIYSNSGVLSGREFTEANGLIWSGGTTISSAIGQAYNLFSPLQLANYSATIANGGTRYRARLVEEVKSYDDSTVIKSSAPEVLNKLNVSEENVRVVQEGMYLVTQPGGTADTVLSDYEISSAAKTGTAEISPEGSSDNSIFIGYAPFDKPEIAIGVVLEHGESSLLRACPNIAKDFYQYYFFDMQKEIEAEENKKNGTSSTTEENKTDSDNETSDDDQAIPSSSTEE